MRALFAVSALPFLLSACGGNSKPPQTSALNDTRVGRVLGHATNSNDLAIERDLQTKLTSDIWIGLNRNLTPRPNTYLQLSPLHQDPVSNAGRYRFQLTLGRDIGLRGVTHSKHTDDGAIRGFIEGSSDEIGNDICISPFSAFHGGQNGPIPNRLYRLNHCFSDATNEYAGSLVTFRFTSSDVGPLLSMEFKPAEHGYNDQITVWNFQTQSDLQASQAKIAPQK